MSGFFSQTIVGCAIGLGFLMGLADRSLATCAIAFFGGVGIIAIMQLHESVRDVLESLRGKS